MKRELKFATKEELRQYTKLWNNNNNNNNNNHDNIYIAVIYGASHMMSVSAR